MHEVEDLAPLLLGFLAARTVALCTVKRSLQVLAWAKSLARQPRHAISTTHAASVGGPR